MTDEYALTTEGGVAANWPRKYLGSSVPASIGDRVILFGRSRAFVYDIYEPGSSNARDASLPNGGICIFSELGVKVAYEELDDDIVFVSRFWEPGPTFWLRDVQVTPDGRREVLPVSPVELVSYSDGRQVTIGDRVVFDAHHLGCVVAVAPTGSDLARQLKLPQGGIAIVLTSGQVMFLESTNRLRIARTLNEQTWNHLEPPITPQGQ